MIIGISGKKGSGKDLVAKIWQCLEANKINGYNLNVLDIIRAGKFEQNAVAIDSGWHKKMWAEKLKQMVCLMIGCTMEQLEDEKFKEMPLSPEWDIYSIWSAVTTKYVAGIYSPTQHIFPTREKAEAYIRRNESKVPNSTENIYKFEKHSLTPRKIMQILGTECGRKLIHPQVWINATMADYKATYRYELINPMDRECSPIDIVPGSEKLPNWIITDTRFPNEAKAIKERKGLMIRVNRPISIRMPELWAKFIEDEDYTDSSINEMAFISWLRMKDYEKYRVLTHESETALDDYKNFDYVINNDGDIEKIIEEVSSFRLSL